MRVRKSGLIHVLENIWSVHKLTVAASFILCTEIYADGCFIIFVRSKNKTGIKYFVTSVEEIQQMLLFMG